MSIVVLSAIGDAAQPSPSIWGSCPNKLLEDRGLGFFKHTEFLGFDKGTYVAATDAILPGFNDALQLSTSDSVVFSSLTGKTGGYLKAVTPATDNTGFALFSAPLGAIVRNSGNKFWFETRFQLNELADSVIFVGLADETAADKDVVVNDPSNSAVGTTKASQSVIGFISKQTASAVSAFNAIYKKTTSTVVSVLADVTNATGIPLASRVSIAATTEVKLGLRFDGIKTITFYANGYRVATQEVDATVDQSSTFAAVVAYKVGSAAAKGIAFDWTRYGFQSRA